jgi:uncharacterized protein YlxP (DUF503 family)
VQCRIRWGLVKIEEGDLRLRCYCRLWMLGVWHLKVWTKVGLLKSFLSRLQTLLNICILKFGSHD